MKRVCVKPGQDSLTWSGNHQDIGLHTVYSSDFTVEYCRPNVFIWYSCVLPLVRGTKYL